MFAKKVKTTAQIVGDFSKVTSELEATAAHFATKGEEHAAEMARQQELHSQAYAESAKAARVAKKLNAFFNED